MLQSCPNCGSPNQQGYRFCSKCGANLDAAAAGQKAPLSGPPPALPAQNIDLTRAADAPTSPRRRSWGLPAVAVSGALLLVLAGIALYFTFASGTRTLNVSENEPPGLEQRCPKTGETSEEAELKRVICISNEEQIWAMSKLNTEVLKGSRTGRALEENIDEVEKLRKHNIYGEPVNLELKFLDVKIEGEKATVKTYERWMVSFYQQNDKKLVQKLGPDAYNETYHMVKLDGKWLIERVDFVPQTPTTTN
jgi:hypothetical protein